MQEREWTQSARVTSAPPQTVAFGRRYDRRDMSSRTSGHRVMALWLTALLIVAAIGSCSVAAAAGAPQVSSATAGPSASGGPSGPVSCSAVVSTAEGLEAANAVPPGPLYTVCVAPGSITLNGGELKWTRPNSVIAGQASGGGPLPALNGRVTVAADNVTLRELSVSYGNGAVRLWADHVSLLNSKVTAPRGTCVEVGYLDAYLASQPLDMPGSGGGYHKVHDVLISGNTIDGCANNDAFLDTWVCNNSGFPGIYSQWVDGLEISENIIVRTALRGIQLFPSNRNVTISNNLLRKNSIAMNIGTETRAWLEASAVAVTSNVFAEQWSEDLVAAHPTMQSSCTGNRSYLGYNSPPGVTVDDQATEHSPSTAVDPSVEVSRNCGTDVRPRPDYTTSFVWRENIDAAAAFVSATDHRQTSASPCAGAGPVALRPLATTNLLVSDVTVAEGNAGSAPATFTITRTGVTTGTSTASYTTPSNGAATAGSDYIAVPPTTVSFAAGETTKTVSATVLGDTVAEPSEAFHLVLSAPTGATISDSIGTALIVNDDALPSLAVNDVTLAEGNTGTTPATFAITRTGDTTGTSTVSYTTTPGSATAGSDYTTVPPTRITYSPGETTKTVTVTILGDTAVEPNETFSLVLSSPQGATLSDTTGPASIVNDDAQPTLAVHDVTITEGNAATTPATFTITRTGLTTGTTTVSYTTPTNGSATAGADYTTIGPTTVTFGPGETTKAVTANVAGDTTVEANEYFYLALSAPTGATLADYLGIATIVNDDGPSTSGPSTFLGVSDVTVAEHNTGSGPATFTITRSGVTTGTTTVSYATTPGTAAAGSDYTTVGPATVTFNPGETTKTMPVGVVGDTTVEANEAFSLTLSSPSGATLSDTTGTATILNDDAQPTLAVTDVTAAEGNAGATPVTFTVTRAGATTGTSTVSYATTPGTATAGTDYTATSGTLTFNPGQTVKAVTVNVTGDTAVEANEHFYLALSAPTGATFADNVAPAFVVNDDATRIAAGNATVAEGNAGSTPATFTLTRSEDTTGTSTVSYATTAGTATAGSDYTAIGPTTVTFNPGETTKTVTVNVIGDTTVEAREHFYLTLSAPTGATISDTSGLALIFNDD